MKWYNDSKYQPLIQKASNDIYNYASSKFPEVKITQSDAGQILNAYLDYSSTIGRPFTVLNKAENQKPFQDDFIKGMYIIIKNFPDENAFKNSRFDLTLRDKIWVALEPIKKIVSVNYPILYTPYNVPSDYQVAQQAQQVYQPQPIPPQPYQTAPTAQPYQTAPTAQPYQVAQQPYQVAPQPYFPPIESNIGGNLAPLLVGLTVGGFILYHLFKKGK
jgi:hypothetical protein